MMRGAEPLYRNRSGHRRAVSAHTGLPRLRSDEINLNCPGRRFILNARTSVRYWPLIASPFKVFE